MRGKNAVSGFIFDVAVGNVSRQTNNLGTLKLVKMLEKVIPFPNFTRANRAFCAQETENTLCILLTLARILPLCGV